MKTGHPKRRVSVNAMFSTSSWLLPMALSFVTTPIVLSHLGTDAYGLYVLVLGFVWYSFSFGVGKAATKYVAEYRAAGEIELVSESVSAAFWFSFGLGVVGFAIIALASGSLISYVLRVPDAFSSEAQLSLLIAAAIIFVTMLSQVAPNVLLGLQRFDRHALIASVGSLILNLGVIWLALNGEGVVALMVWNLIYACLLAIFYVVSARRSAPDIALKFRIRPETWKRVIGYGSAIIMTQIFGNILLLFERSWISRNFGIDGITIYVIPMTLALFMHAFVSSIVIVIFPVFNESLADRPRIARIYRTSTKFILALTAFALLTSITLGKALLAAWVGIDIAGQSGKLLSIHIAAFGIVAAGTVAWNVAESFGHARATVAFTGAWFAISTALMILIGDRYGLEGIAAARLVGASGVIVLMIFVERNLLSSFSLGYWVTALLRLSLAACSAGFLQWLVSIWLPALAAVVVGLTSGAVIYSAVLLCSRYFDGAEMNWFRRSVGLAAV